MGPLDRDYGHATRATTGVLVSKGRNERKSSAISLADVKTGRDDVLVSPKFQVRLVSEAGKQVEGQLSLIPVRTLR